MEVTRFAKTTGMYFLCNSIVTHYSFNLMQKNTVMYLIKQFMFEFGIRFIHFVLSTKQVLLPNSPPPTPQW